jgi:hypothetical protein
MELVETRSSGGWIQQDSRTEDCAVGFDQARKFKEKRQLGWMAVECEAQDEESAVDE